MKQTFKMKIITEVIFYLFLVVGIFYAAEKPYYNWDMVAYMGCVLKNNTSSQDDFHKKTYEILKNEIDKNNFKRLTSANYGLTMESNQKAFEENLSYYSIRIAYIYLISVIHRLGIPLTFSTVLISLISVFLIISLIHVILSKEINNYLIASILPIIILFLPQTIHLARLSTPDALSSLLLLVITAIYLYKFNWYFILLLMILAIMTRTDNIIFCVLLLFFEILFPENKKKILIFLSFIISLFLIYFLINTTHNYGGWNVLFYNHFINRLNFPLSLTPDLTMKDYIFTIARKVPHFLPSFLLILLVYIKFKNKITKDFFMVRGAKVITVCITFFLFRFLLFPSFDSRFYFVIALILLITFIVDRKHFLIFYNS